MWIRFRSVTCILALLWQPLLTLGQEVKPDVIEVSPFPPGGDFRLQSHEGSFRLSSLRGQVVLLFFGYTTCPDICPATLGTLVEALSLLTVAERVQVAVVFVSVDPERDTQRLLRDYLASFPVRALGLTGESAQIAAVADRYGAQYSRVELPGSALRYGIDHSAAVALIDRRGRLQKLLRHTAAPGRYASEIRRLLSLPAGGKP